MYVIGSRPKQKEKPVQNPPVSFFGTGAGVGTGNKIESPDEVAYVMIRYATDNGAGELWLNYENGMKNIEIPDFEQNDAEITFFTRGRQNSISVPFILFIKLQKDGSKLTSKEKEKLGFLFNGDELYSELQFQFCKDNTRPPEIHYTDDTEKYIMQFPEISQDYIESKETGIWSEHGLRLLHLNLTNVPKEAKKISCQLVFNMVNNETLQQEIRFENDAFEEIAPDENDTRSYCNREYLVRVDTSLLGTIFQQYPDDIIRAECRGFCEIDFKFAVVPNGECSEELYRLPVRIELINTAYPDISNKYSIVDNSTTISVDFGTSSTCVAIDDGEPHLIQLTSVHDARRFEDCENMTVNLYETPTNLVVYRWDELYKEWQNSNSLQPLVRRHLDEDILNNDERHEFDFGYGVKKGLKEDGKKYLESSITELKMIPNHLADGKTEILHPYHMSKNNIVYLVGEPNQEDETHFNPIAFYGYLLGRAINRVSGGKIYTNYSLTYPVKFKKEIRESIRKSLEYGILRSLPSSIRNKKNEDGESLCKVRMEYPEPVAYAGAVCEIGSFSLMDGKAKNFAVFDFGGGTLDFSFGMYRLPDEENEDECDYETVLEFFGTGGDETIGGEHLVHLLSYWIISANKEQMIEKNIPFLLPDGEKIPNGCDEIFQRSNNSTMIAKYNTIQMNESISRLLLEGRYVSKNDGYSVINLSGETQGGNETILIRLIDMQGNEQEDIELTFDIEELYESFKERIEKAVSLFLTSMSNSFNNEFAVAANAKVKSELDEKLYIFLAGNTSRHPLIASLIQEALGEDAEICLVGADNDETEYNREKVTPKTAVALGLAKISSSALVYPIMHINPDENPPYARCVARIRLNHHEWLIEKNTQDTDWKQLGIIKGSIKFAYCHNEDHSDVRNSMLNFSNSDNGKYCYIRPYGDVGISYIALPKGENPNDNPESYATITKTENLP